MAHVALRRVHARLPRPASDARRRWIDREAIAIAISDGTHVGRAEAAPLPQLSTETLPQVERALATVPWADLDIDADDPLTLAARWIPEDLPSARFAVEAALLDLVGRARNLSVAALLAEREPAGAIATAALIDDLEMAVARARSALDAGAGALKIKIGRPGESSREIAMIRALRREFGGELRIRADANGALSDIHDPRIGALTEIGCELLEDPFPIEHLLEQAPLPLPIALDESLATEPARALRALEQGLAHAVVLKPSLLGGIGRSLALALSAKTRGARIIISHLYDAPRSFAACANLALALGPTSSGMPEVHGLARYAGLEAWVDETGNPIEVPRLLGAYRIEQSNVGGLG